MTFLDQTVLNGFARCQKHEVTKRDGSNWYRQCVHDAEHAGVHEFGVWVLLPVSALVAQEVAR